MYSLRRYLFAALIGFLAASVRAEDAAAPTVTATGFPGAETFIVTPAEPQPVRIHVFKPVGGKATDLRPGLIWLFGGGFVRGTPDQSIKYAKRAASWGMIGFAADYRTIERWPDTDGIAGVADVRAALRWAQDHAAELGLDPRRIVVGGASAGGHLALWTAITASPPGLDPDRPPLYKPAALLLSCPACDTSLATGMRGNRFGSGDTDLYSPLQHLDPDMPPTLLIHGDADTTVPYAHAVALHAALIATGNTCHFITVPGGNHKFTTEIPEWGKRLPVEHRAFLEQLGLLPVEP